MRRMPLLEAKSWHSIHFHLLIEFLIWYNRKKITNDLWWVKINEPRIWLPSLLGNTRPWRTHIQVLRTSRTWGRWMLWDHRVSFELGNPGAWSKRSGQRRNMNRLWAWSASSETVNLVQAPAEPWASNSCPGDPSPVEIPDLSPEQVQVLLSLTETLKPSYEKFLGNFAWIFDSGASCHITGDPNLMQETEQISPISNGLPNRTHTIAKKEGSITMGQLIKLNKVLYVLPLRCNLILIAKLCKELNCSVTFFDDFCIL